MTFLYFGKTFLLAALIHQIGQLLPLKMYQQLSMTVIHSLLLVTASL